MKADYDTRLARWIASSGKVNGKRVPQPRMDDFVVASSRNLFYLRLAADFPVIPKLHYDNPGWTFKSEEVYHTRWDNLPADSLYARHLDEIIESSTKVKVLGEIFREMDERSAKAVAAGGRKDRMVLTTAHPVALFLLD